MSDEILLVATHIGVKILCYPRSETVGSLLETKGISGPPPFGHRTRVC